MIAGYYPVMRSGSLEPCAYFATLEDATDYARLHYGMTVDVYARKDPREAEVERIDEEESTKQALADAKDMIEEQARIDKKNAAQVISARAKTLFEDFLANLEDEIEEALG